MRELTRYIDRIEHGLEQYLKAEDCPQKIVYEAMKYSVEDVYKRQAQPVKRIGSIKSCPSSPCTIASKMQLF